LASKDSLCRIKFCSYAYEFPDIKTGPDADWLKVYFYFSSPGFRIEFDEPMFRAGDLEYLLSDLQSLITLKQKSVNFTPSENIVLLDFSFDSDNTIHVKGMFENSTPYYEGSLDCEFKTDLVNTRKFVEGLKGIVNLFPSRDQKYNVPHEELGPEPLQKTKKVSLSLKRPKKDNKLII
jgi:hypothetical protein